MPAQFTQMRVAPCAALACALSFGAYWLGGVIAARDALSTLLAL